MENKLFLLVAYGTNSVEVPCRASNSKEKLKNFIKENFTNPQFNNNSVEVNEEDEGHEKIFTRYNDGCGGVWKYKIKPLELDSSLGCFDLD